MPPKRRLKIAAPAALTGDMTAMPYRDGRMIRCGLSQMAPLLGRFLALRVVPFRDLSTDEGLLRYSIRAVAVGLSATAYFAAKTMG
jgi:hypothetical protein